MANILIVDDDLSLREVLEIALIKKEHSVWAAPDSATALSLLHAHNMDLILLDLRLGQESGIDLLVRIREVWTDIPVLMVTAYADTKSAIAALKYGARDYIHKPFDLDDFLFTVERTLETARLQEENIWLKGQIGRQYEEIIGQSSQIQSVFALIKRIAPTNINVLVTGESGTGKELVARAIHKESLRMSKPFLAINCGGLPENLVESELFGFQKGAFTSADRSKKGLLSMAEGGTLFLDEVGELAPSTQVKLLRYVQERCFIPLGGTEELRSDVRIIAATNRNVEQSVADGNFREDLYYRLSGVKVELPPLRERRDDILALAEHFLAKACRSQKRSMRGFDPEAKKKLVNYTYPGNVRELENIIERAVALAPNDTIDPDSLIIYEKIPTQDHASGVHKVLSGQLTLDEYLAEHEQRVIAEALQRCSGHKGRAAEMVGLNFRQFRYRLTKLGEKDDE
ncbi:MAG: sigma-54 dependent transcriptional regulator [Desulfomicrobium sp.]|nr:sigma-54 dependent transcriptional regulator [Desulfomicrobium sp.]NLV97407.1 sigma-54-dependent Fis family transcriptional regulator [Desulfovibrionales bacterium]